MIYGASAKRFRMGPSAQKILLLLGAGLALSLSGSPAAYFRVIRGAAKEWKSINERTLHQSIKNLYKSRMIDYRENNDGTITLALTENGKKLILRFNLETLRIEKPPRWDGLWRLVIFDIPENFKQGRNALAETLKKLGFIAMQKSVFIYPYECAKEVDFVIEIFNLRPYVRFVIANKTDIDLDLKNRFKIKV